MARDWGNYKVSVFISSKCDNADDLTNSRLQYGVMRKALKLLLEETGMCTVYAFEEGSGSSYDVVHSYMDPLEDSDLVIIVVDNKDNVTPATMNEINRAKALKKKCIYVFCDEREKNITEVQREIQIPSGPRYKVAHEFSEIAKIAYETAITDILNIYKSYCRGRVDYTDRGSDKEDEIVALTLASDSEISKDFVEGFTYTKYVVKSEAGVAFGVIDKSDGIDADCADLIGAVIGCSLTAAPDFSKIRSSVKKLHKGNVQKLVQLRYDAVEQYFLGDIKQCAEKLKECLSFCDSCKSLPKWMINDTALDLRNIQMEIDREKDVINFHPQGQERLEEDREPLYYPVLDRLVSDFNDDLASRQLNLLTQSPYTVNLGGIDFTVDKACKSFLVAFYYGSITQMLLLRKRLTEYLMSVSMELRNHKMFMFCIRLLLLANDEKSLKKYLTTYGENTNSINSQDVEQLFYGIIKQPISIKRLLARIYLFKYFGYYYSEEKYNEEAANLVAEIKESIDHEVATSILVKPMLEAIAENDRRMDNALVTEYILHIFRNDCRRYYDDVFNLMSKYSYETANLEEYQIYQNIIVQYLSEEGALSKYHNLALAAQNLRQCEKISHVNLDGAVKKYAPKFYEDTYSLNTQKLKAEEFWQYIRRFLTIIDKDNETQGKNGTYVGSSYNPYITIANIIANNDVKYNSEQIKQILSSARGTLLSASQTLEAKASALTLICTVQLNQPRNRQIKTLVHELKEQWEQVLEAQDLFLVKGYGRENLELNFFMLRQMVEPVDNQEAFRIFVLLQNSEMPNKMTAMRTIERLLVTDGTALKSEYAGPLMQFVMNESNDANSDLRFRAMSLMMKMLSSDYRDLILQRFVEMIDHEPYKNKVGMLYRLSNYTQENSRVDYIFEKGKTDSHYWVRKVANLHYCR